MDEWKPPGSDENQTDRQKTRQRDPKQKEPCGHMHDTGCDAANPAERALKHPPVSGAQDKTWVKTWSTWVPTPPTPPQLLPGRYLSWSYSCERCMWLF